MTEFARVGPRRHMIPKYANIETGTPGRPHVAYCYTIFIPTKEQNDDTPKCLDCQEIMIEVLNIDLETLVTEIHQLNTELYEGTYNGQRSEE